MHILTDNLRSDAHRTLTYASASVLNYRTDCAIVRNPFSGRKLIKEMGF